MGGSTGDWNPLNSSVFTGAGTPWGAGDSKMDLDPSHSWMGTGAGTPWGAGDAKMDLDPSHSWMSTGAGTSWGAPTDPSKGDSGGSTPITTATPAPKLAPTGALASYGKPSMDFRNAYLGSLKPNIHFNNMAQTNKPTAFGFNPTGGKQGIGRF